MAEVAVKMASHHFCRGHGFPFMRLRQALHLCVAHQRSYLTEQVGYIKPIKYCRAIWTRTKLKTSRPVFLFVKEVKPSENFHSERPKTLDFAMSLALELEAIGSHRVHQVSTDDELLQPIKTSDACVVTHEHHKTEQMMNMVMQTMNAVHDVCESLKSVAGSVEPYSAISVEVKLWDEPINLLKDTGAAVSLIDEKVWQRASNGKLQPTNRGTNIGLLMPCVMGGTVGTGDKTTRSEKASSLFDLDSAKLSPTQRSIAEAMLSDFPDTSPTHVLPVRLKPVLEMPPCLGHAPSLTGPEPEPPFVWFPVPGAYRRKAGSLHTGLQRRSVPKSGVCPIGAEVQRV
uniref:Uncharacterized protein n=1 Tax=Timema poppense TaxID=170557 RepID=A0A7R9GX89_TIMPO|nr:unnamed protein product [Timema poppensis]